jgi:hypothetical protein
MTHLIKSYTTHNAQSCQSMTNLHSGSTLQKLQYHVLDVHDNELASHKASVTFVNVAPRSAHDHLEEEEHNWKEKTEVDRECNACLQSFLTCSTVCHPCSAPQAIHC